MNESYYIVYDDFKIHWFMRKEVADRRNLQAIKNHIARYPYLKSEEVYLNTETVRKIKKSLVEPSFAVLNLIRTENPEIQPIQFPDTLY